MTLVRSFLGAIFIWLTALSVAHAADRVVVAGGVTTEIVYLLNAQDRLVGVDETSRHPATAQALPQIGYFRRLSAEGVLSLAPDLLIASPSAGPPVVVDQIRSAGVQVEIMPEVETLDDLAPKIRAVAKALDLPDKGLKLATKFEAEVAELRRTRPDWKVPPRVMFVLTIRDASPLVAGAGTVSDEIIRESGAVNVAEFEGYKTISREAVIAAAPDLILMTDGHADTLGGPGVVLERAEFRLTPAGVAERALTLPALTILGLGPRTPASIRKLRAALNP